ncbi:MAG TPA: hypothetical protein VFY39_11320, partial [Gammaproteobacteria bacterium]|nr:hypothetical protein [Gammaproteobacteria bacterium]
GAPRFFEGGGSARLFPTALHRLLQTPRAWPFPTSTTLWGLDRIEAMQAREVVAVLPSLGEGLHEFMFHPRRIDADADTRCLLELREQAA